MDLTNECGCPYGSCSCDSYASYVQSEEQLETLSQSIARSKRRFVANSYKKRVMLEQICDCGHSLRRHGAYRELSQSGSFAKKHANGGKCNHDEYCFCIKFSLSQLGEIDTIESQDSMKLTIRCGTVKVVVDLETGVWTCDEDAVSGTRPGELCLYLRGW